MVNPNLIFLKNMRGGGGVLFQMKANAVPLYKIKTEYSKDCRLAEMNLLSCSFHGANSKRKACFCQLYYLKWWGWGGV